MLSMVETYRHIKLLEKRKVTLLAFLQYNRLLPCDKLCVDCNEPCKIILENNTFYFICRKSVNGNKCNFKYTLNYYSCFCNSHLSYFEILSIFYHFVSSETFPNVLLNLSPTTLHRWSHFCRMVCKAAIWDYDYYSMGGPNVVIEMAVLWYKTLDDPPYSDGSYIIAAVERDSQNCFLVPVERSNRGDMILNIVNKRIRHQTTIITNYFKNDGYLKKKGYIDLAEQQNITFIRSSSQNTLNNVQGVISKLIESLSAKMIPHKDLDEYSATIIWKRLHKYDNLFTRFLQEITQLYPV